MITCFSKVLLRLLLMLPLIIVLPIFAQGSVPAILGLLLDEEEPPQYDYTYFSPRAARVNTGSNAGDQSQPDIAVLDGPGGSKDVVVFYTQDFFGGVTTTKDIYARQFDDKAIARMTSGHRFFSIGGNTESWPRAVSKANGRAGVIYPNFEPKPSNSSRPDRHFLFEAETFHGLNDPFGRYEEIIATPPHCFENEAACDGRPQHALNPDIAQLSNGDTVTVYSVDTSTLARELRVTINHGDAEFTQKTLDSYTGGRRPFDIDVVATQSGGFAVLWYHNPNENFYYFQIFDADGEPIIDRLTINDNLTGTESALNSLAQGGGGHGYGSLAALTNNRYAITWVKLKDDDDVDNVGVLTILDGLGRRVTPDTEFTTLTTPSGLPVRMKETDVAQIFDDAVLVTWSGNMIDGQGSQAFAWSLYGWIATIDKPIFDHVEHLAGLSQSDLGEGQIAVTADGEFTLAFELTDLREEGSTGIFVPDSDGIDVNIKPFEVSRTLKESDE